MRISLPRLALVLGLLGLYVPARAQSALLSSTTFNGGSTDSGNAVARAANGDIYVAGQSSAAATSDDIWIGRFNSGMTLLSSVTINGSANGSDVAYSLAIAPGGDIYVVGVTSIAGQGYQPWMGRFSPALALVSSVTYATPFTYIVNWLHGVAFSTTGSLYAVGSVGPAFASQRLWLANINPATLAVISSTTFFNGFNANYADALSIDGSGNLYVTGGVAPAPATSSDLWVGKFDSAMVLQASATVTGAGGNTDAGLGVIAHPAGFVYVTGIINNGGVTEDAWIGKYDQNLVFKASVSVAGSAGSDDYGNAIALGNGNNLIVVGEVNQSGQGRNIWEAEYTPSLALVSSRTLNSGGAVFDGAVGVSVDTAAASVLVSGYANADVWLGNFSITPATPTAPSGFAGVAQSTIAILWSWTDASSNETGFRVMLGAANVSGDLPAGTTTWTQSLFAANTSSGPLFAQAFNGGGTANSGSATRFTLAGVPTGLAAGAPGVSSVTLSWSGSASSYQLERSTGAGFAVVASTPSLSYADTGLSSGSTYFYRVLGLNGDAVVTAYTSTITVVTLPVVTVPAAPTSFAGAAQSTVSIQWSWTDNAANETGYRVMSGAVNLSGDLGPNTTIWLQTGLSSNTAYGPYFARAFNSTGTADSGVSTVYTLSPVPTGLGSSSVSSGSAVISWTGSASSFRLDRSSGAGFTQVYSSATASFGDAGLNPASTYYYRVQSLNGDAVASAFTSSITVVTLPGPTPPAAPSAFAGAAQSTVSIQWSWTDNAANETGYRVMSGAVNLSGDLPAGSTLWLQTGLGIDASTGPLLAQAFNSSGTANSGAVSRYSLAAVPGTPSFSAVQQTSATISWSASGNPGAVVYQLERSTGTGFGLQFSGTATTYFDGYLTPGATHFFRVRALNGDGVASADSSTAALVALPPPPLPNSAGTPTGTALGVSSVTWTWVLASGATNHFLYRASDNSYLGSSSSGPFVQTALTPNTAYGLRAAGVNVGGTGPLSPSGTVYTLAAAPSAATMSVVAATSLTPSWSLNGNPGFTVAQLERSTNAVVYSTLAAGAFTSYVHADLIGCTTYYYRVRNANGDGLTTAYVSFQGVTANTTPAPPSGLTAAANGGGTVSLSWNLSPTEGVTGYRLFWDAGSGTVSYAAPIASPSSTTTSFTTGVLASSETYTFALRAAHRCGVVESTGALAMSGAAVAAPALRAAIKEPDSGKRIHGNRVTILGELIDGTPSAAQQVAFQYKLAASTAWALVPAADVNHPNPDFSFPYFVHWNVNLMAAGDYDLRAVAYDRSGVPDPAPPAVRVTIVAANADIDENDDNGAVKKDQTIANGVTSVIDTAGAGASDPSVRVTIPAGAVNAATATVSVTANPPITAAPPSGQNLVGSAIKIDLSNGQSALNGTAAITLTYPETVLFPSLLQIYYLDEATGRWSRDFASVVDTASRTVTGNTPHFSTFALMFGTAFAPNLDSVQAYPVPYKPNGSDPDEGRPFSAGNPNSGIIFANLAMGSEIKIYTMTGRLVASLDSAPITGTMRWDVRNQDGRDVASGAYFAVITAAGQKSVVKKLVIIR